MERRKVKGGLKTKGLRNAPYEGMKEKDCSYSSKEYMPGSQGHGQLSAKPVKHDHKVIGKDM